MKEYEYSFKVKDIKPYISYCKDNGYEVISDSSQIRELYRNPNKTLARITTNMTDEYNEKVLDFKDDNMSYETMKISRETIPLKIEKYNEKAVYSILEMLGYKKDKVLNRKRIVFKREEVIFELDSYTSPEEMFVVAIEGNSEKVDLVYEEVTQKINNRV